MEQRKNYIHIVTALLLITFIIITIIVGILLNKRSKTEKKWKEAVENTKAYSELYSNSEHKIN